MEVIIIAKIKVRKRLRRPTAAIGNCLGQGTGPRGLLAIALAAPQWEQRRRACQAYSRSLPPRLAPVALLQGLAPKPTPAAYSRSLSSKLAPEALPQGLPLELVPAAYPGACSRSSA